MLAQRPARQALSWYDQKRELKALRPFAAAEGPVNLMNVPSIVLQDVLQRVARAYERWSRPDATGRRAGFPHFRRRNDYDTWTYALLGNSVHLRETGDPRGPALDLYRIGRLRVRWHRPLRGTVKTISIKREPDGWYAIFTCADVPVAPLPPTGHEAALDMRVTPFATLEDGAGNVVDIENPRYYERALRKLRLAQRRLARRQKGSKGREQAQQLLARAHQKVRRQRTYFHHEAARALVRQYDTIYREDLSIARMLAAWDAETPPAVRVARNRGIADSAWGQFFGILDAKAEETGRRVRAVPPQYTTATCSSCGRAVELRPPYGVHTCPHCGVRLPRALNAARNILREGRRRQGEPAAERGSRLRVRGG